MTCSIHASAVTSFHDRMLAQAGWPGEFPPQTPGSAWEWIAVNHRYNSLLWNEEDQARRTDVDAAVIASCKRLIDRYNQQRNDAVEKLDEVLLGELEHVKPQAEARLNSETAGAMIDRLSILALKIFHMHEQTLRVDAGAEHRAQCQAKLERLKLQRGDLAHCLDALLEDAAAGRAWFRVYRQFKMYNDPNLNPWLYGARQPAANGTAA